MPEICKTQAPKRLPCMFTCKAAFSVLAFYKIAWGGAIFVAPLGVLTSSGCVNIVNTA